MDKLAINGGNPVRDTFLPYGKQWIDKDDISKVVKVLESDWITTGPILNEFETKFAELTDSKYAIALSSGTAALHVAVCACNLKPGDEAITSPFTFAATSNSLLFQGSHPVFADVKRDTYNIDPAEIKKRITANTRAIMPVDFAGQPCDIFEIKEIARENDLYVIEDAAHAVGADYNGKKIGSISDATIFSFHPVKQMTTGEGGIITTNNEEIAESARLYRNHGLSKDAVERFGKHGSWYYEMTHLGFNYRLTDIHAALGLGQLEKLIKFIERRTEIASVYNAAFEDVEEIRTPTVKTNIKHAWHLYVIEIIPDKLKVDRDQIFKAFRAENIGVNVHYIPVHLHPYYHDNLGCKTGDYPVAEKIFERVISLPMFPGMSDDDVNDVVNAVKKVVEHYKNGESE